MLPGRLLLLLTLITACGKPSKGMDAGLPPYIQPMQTTGEFFDAYFADSYFVTDPTCQAEGSGGGVIERANITLWQGGKAAPWLQSFAKTQARPALTSTAISLVQYGLYQQSDCGSALNFGACVTKTKTILIAAASPLNICDTKRDFARTSVEGVGLTSLAMIAAASDFYNKVAGHLPDLPTASLLILPKVETLYADGQTRSEAVDNLSYVPNFAGSPTFAVFPKGAYNVAHGRWVDVNLWEIPWTLAHEFGHHIFRFHSELDDASSGIAVVPLHSFTAGQVSDAGLSLDQANTARHVGNAEVIAAANEGFADLFAYYAHGAVPGMTSGIDCFHENRDPGFDAFADDQPKVLNESVLAQFMTGTKAAANADCSVPNYQDVHIIGAILAHGVDQIFTAVAGLDAAKKSALLLDWAGRMGATARDLQVKDSKALTLGMLVHDALLTVATANTLPATACAAATKVFPVYSAAWFPGEFSCK